MLFSKAVLNGHTMATSYPIRVFPGFSYTNTPHASFQATGSFSTYIVSPYERMSADMGFELTTPGKNSSCYYTLSVPNRLRCVTMHCLLSRDKLQYMWGIHNKQKRLKRLFTNNVSYRICQSTECYYSNSIAYSTIAVSSDQPFVFIYEEATVLP